VVAAGSTLRIMPGAAMPGAGDGKRAESKASIARECARARVTAIGELFEGQKPEDRAATVRQGCRA